MIKLLMNPKKAAGTLVTLICMLISAGISGQEATPVAGPDSGERVYLDQDGVIRWKDSDQEVALFGANYCLPSACDYRAARYYSDDLKSEIRKDMAHFVRMGWDGLRVCFWGDFQNTDSLGNLVSNEHLDLMDYLIYEADRRGIQMLLSPIVTYSSQWPDAMDQPVTGFSTFFSKSELGTHPGAIKAQTNYLTQLLNHVNPYTGNAIGEEPGILFIEMINEPWHHSEDTEGSIRYIDALVGAVRATGCRKLVFHNVSQDFNIAGALARSTIQGISFAWYPTGLVSGRTLRGNYLRTVDSYDLMKLPALNRMPRIVYEFDSPDLLSPVMYPAMVRTFRSVGTQFAAMFSYDMLVSAGANLGWQTHYLNLVYTPEKAAGAIIAARAMRELPRYQQYGPYPGNTRFGPFRVSYRENLSEYITPGTYMHTGNTDTPAPDPDRLEKIVGRGNSPLVSYEGNGLYFLDKVDEGVWRLELYPDAVPVRDPFAAIGPQNAVTRLVFGKHRMEIRLPDLGAAFDVSPSAGLGDRTRVTGGTFELGPGVYTLSRWNPARTLSLPATIGSIAYDEYIVPPSANLPLELRHEPGPRYQAGKDIQLEAWVVDEQAADSVVLFIRTPGSGFRAFRMEESSLYVYRAKLPGDSHRDPFHEYCITVYQGEERTTFPGRINRSPEDWDFTGTTFWPLEVISADRPFPLFTPLQDARLLSFTRIGDHIRHGIFAIVEAPGTESGALRISLPGKLDLELEDYTASLYIGDRLSQLVDPDRTTALLVSARGLQPGVSCILTLVESDGMSWNTSLELSGDWLDFEIPLDDLAAGRGIMLPQGFPGNWNYWLDPPEGRGGKSDRIRMDRVEHLQISVRPGDQALSGPGFEISRILILTK